MNVDTAPQRRREMPPLLTLTDAAAARLKEIQVESSMQLLRVSVKGKGCAGMTYDLSWVDAAGAGDEKVSDKGVSFLVDRKATLFLTGTVMDFEVSPLSSRFEFRNPNETSRCGCGESFSA